MQTFARLHTRCTPVAQLCVTSDGADCKHTKSKKNERDGDNL